MILLDNIFWKTEMDLCGFPQLKKWAENHWALGEASQSHGEFLLLETCHIINQQENHGILWASALKKFVYRSQNIASDLSYALELAGNLHCDYIQVFAHLTETAIADGDGPKIYGTLKKISDESKIVTIRFLTAWTAFNNNQYEQCLEDCEPIMERNHYVYQLAAQAMNYLGRYRQASELLGIATQLAPNDGNGWFLMAKSLLLAEDLGECLKAVERCLKYIPDDLEVYSLSLLAGCHKKASDDQRKSVFEINKDLIKNRNLPALMYLKVLENCSLIADPAAVHQALDLMEASRWNICLREAHELQNLASLLKTLYQKGDSKGSMLVLDFVKVSA